MNKKLGRYDVVSCFTDEDITNVCGKGVLLNRHIYWTLS